MGSSKVRNHVASEFDKVNDFFEIFKAPFFSFRIFGIFPFVFVYRGELINSYRSRKEEPSNVTITQTNNRSWYHLAYVTGGPTTKWGFGSIIWILPISTKCRVIADSIFMYCVDSYLLGNQIVLETRSAETKVAFVLNFAATILSARQLADEIYDIYVKEHQFDYFVSSIAVLTLKCYHLILPLLLWRKKERLRALINDWFEFQVCI